MLLPQIKRDELAKHVSFIVKQPQETHCICQIRNASINQENALCAFFFNSESVCIVATRKSHSELLGEGDRLCTSNFSAN